MQLAADIKGCLSSWAFPLTAVSVKVCFQTLYCVKIYQEVWEIEWTSNGKDTAFKKTILDISEMYPFFMCWRLNLAYGLPRSKFFPIALFSVAVFIVIATIACTAAKAFEEQTCTAFTILLVVSIQVPWKMWNLLLIWFVEMLLMLLMLLLLLMLVHPQPWRNLYLAWLYFSGEWLRYKGSHRKRSKLGFCPNWHNTPPGAPHRNLGYIFFRWASISKG